jgi:hypothetical protein
MLVLPLSAASVRTTGSNIDIIDSSRMLLDQISSDTTRSRDSASQHRFGQAAPLSYVPPLVRGMPLRAGWDQIPM